MALVNDIQDNPICLVTFDETVPCVSVTWKQHATRTQFQFIHENILQILKNQSVNKILGDDTALPTIHTEDRNWVIENWIPRAMSAGLKFIGTKRPESHFGRVAVSTVKANLPKSLTLRTFDDLDEARVWLQEASLDNC